MTLASPLNVFAALPLLLLSSFLPSFPSHTSRSDSFYRGQNLYFSFFENFFNIFPDNVTLLTVWDEQTKSLVGGMLLVADFNRKILYYPYGSCLVEYNKHYVNNFMYWQAVQRGKFLKMDYLDLGRSPVDSGTYRYKKHWGAQPIQLHYINFAAGKSLHLPSKDNMGIFIRIWQKMPAIAVNFIGKNIIKYVLP